MMGMNVPEIQLVDLDSGSGLPQGVGELQGFRNELSVACCWGERRLEFFIEDIIVIYDIMSIIVRQI